MKQHVVQPGDCLISIAHKYGLPSWKTLYEHSANKALRELRPDPSRLAPGDRVYIPEPVQKKEPVMPADTNTFVLRRPQVWFSVIIQQDDGRIVRHRPYEIELQRGGKIEGMTDEHGAIKHPIDAEQAYLSLTVWPNGKISPERMRWRVELGLLDPQETETPIINHESAQG